jgi:hypothetical protein
LSVDVYGRECVLVTPKSESKKATGLERIALPRSAWIVSWWRAICCFESVSAISRSASGAVSWCWTVQPTT